MSNGSDTCAVFTRSVTMGYNAFRINALYCYAYLFQKWNIITVNRRCLIYTPGTSSLTVLFEPCRDLTDIVTAHFFPVTVWVSQSHRYVNSTQLYYCDIIMMCKSVPGSLCPCIFGWDTGWEPGNKTTKSVQLPYIVYTHHLGSLM